MQQMNLVDYQSPNQNRNHNSCFKNQMLCNLRNWHYFMYIYINLLSFSALFKEDDYYCNTFLTKFFGKQSRWSWTSFKWNY